ncbi:MAG: C25 family cysteine peptidase [bacterium]|nr:C25 family cysteine peptidase [bacterium]
MKKILNFFFLFLFFTLLYSTEIYKIGKTSEVGFKIEKNSLKYSIKLESFEYSLKDGFLKIAVKNGFKTTKFGYPELPSHRFLLFSKEKDVGLKNVSIGEKKLVDIKIPDKGIYPLQKPLIKSKNENEFFIDERFYNSDEKYPEEVLDLKFVGKRKGYFVYQVEVNPMVYERKTNKLFFFDRIDFEVSENLKTDFEEKSSLKEKFLFVVNSNMKPYIDDFVDLKKKEGYYTEILLIDTVGSTEEEIKNGIQNVYNNTTVPLEYVLLVGDVNIIPNYVGTETDYPPTDLYYSTLEGSDFLPDVGIGRFPVQDTVYLKNIVSKNITYQYSLFSNTNGWTKKGYFMASDDGSYHQVAESTNLYVMDRLRSIGMEVDSLFYYYGTGTNVSTAINSGRSLAVYSGHGDVTYWAGPIFYQSDVLNLTNNDLYPFVSSYACLTGNYAYSSDCFGETWVKKGNGGAVSYLGSSVYSYWDEDDVMERRFFDFYIDSNYTNLSDLIYFAKLSVYNSFPSTGKRYFEQYNLLGDPSLEFYTSFDSLCIDVSSTIPSSDYNFLLHVYSKTNGQPVKDAKVSYLIKDSLIDVKLSDINGEVSFYLEGNVDDTIRFYAFKNCYKPDSAYSVITNSIFYPSIKEIIVKDSLFFFNQPDGIFTSADSGTIYLLVENKGVDTLYSLSCSLFTYSNNIKAYSYLFNFKDTIFPSDTSYSKNSILFKIKDDTKNNTYDSLGFKFFNMDSTLSSRRRFFIKAPETIIDSIKFFSKETNITSFDTINFTVKLKNLSTEKDRKLRVFLSSDDTTVLKVSPEYIDVESLEGLNSIYLEGFKGFVQNVDTFCQVSVKGVYIDTLGFSDTLFKEVYINRKDYLILDYSKSSNSPYFLDSILRSWGYVGDNLKNIDPDNVKNYRFIFLITGSYPNNGVIPSSDEVASKIDSLLKEGVLKLYIEGGEVFYWDPLYSNGYNFNTVCNVKPKSDGTSTSPSIFYGKDGTISEGINLNYTPSYYLDLIDTVNGSKTVFYNSSSVYAISFKDEKYRTVASSFEFGNIVDMDSLSSKSGWLRRIIDFFELKLNVEDFEYCYPAKVFKVLSFDKKIISKDLKLSLYSPKDGKVIVKFYDVSGRNIFNYNFSLKEGINGYNLNLSNLKISSKIIFFKIFYEGNEEFSDKIIFLK